MCFWGETIKKIKILDTTLRDGEQSPGVSLNQKEKRIIAGQLAKLNVDLIEAGFPVASEDEFKAVKRVAEEVEGPKICALARAKTEDIERAGDAISPAKEKRIHCFLSSSDIHLRKQLGISRERALEMSINGIERAKEYCEDVEFSPMDATRTDFNFLSKMIEKAVEAGATVINIPDTVGYAQTDEFGELIRRIRENVRGIEESELSVHCHNDLGLAVANSLKAVEMGADQVEATINGIGERAGNASLEEVVMAMESRKDLYGAETQINSKEIYNTSKLVQDLTGIKIQANKPVVGENAFSHESGIHQQGVIYDRRTYEIIDAELIGKESDLVLGKHSGRHAVQKVLSDLDYDLSEEDVSEIKNRIKELASKKKVLKDDVIAIANEVLGEPDEKNPVKLLDWSLKTEKDGPEAEVKLQVNEKMFQGRASGVGAIDSLYNAIEDMVPWNLKLERYDLEAITGGSDALADLTVSISDGEGKKYMGRAVDGDVLQASLQAFVKAINLFLLTKK